MLIDEEVEKPVGEVNPDALEAVFEDDSASDEEVFIFGTTEEEENEVDIAFEPNPENYW